MSNLVLHCGAHHIDEASLRVMETPVSTTTHVPIPHFFFQELIRNRMAQAGFKIAQVQHAVARDGARYFGLMEIQNGNAEYALTVGMRNAHDKSLASGICVGSTVFVCDNLAFSGEIIIARKHTNQILRDLPVLIEGVVEKVERQHQIQDDRFNAYKDRLLTDQRADNVLVSLFRNGAMSGSELGKAIDQWYEPAHDAFREKANVWRLFNAVTEAGKGHVFQAVKKTRLLHKACDEICEVELAQAA